MTAFAVRKVWLGEPLEDGVPVAELSLNERIPLGRAAGGDFDLGVVAGARLWRCLLRLARRRTW